MVNLLYVWQSLKLLNAISCVIRYAKLQEYTNLDYKADIHCLYTSQTAADVAKQLLYILMNVMVFCNVLKSYDADPLHFQISTSLNIAIHC